MSEYFPKSYKPFGRYVKTELDLSYCSTKAVLKREKGADTSNLAAKSDLASIKAEVDKID